MGFSFGKKLAIAAGTVVGLGLTQVGSASAATVAYTEDFSVNVNGPWTVDLGDAALFNASSDFFEVRNGAFSAQDTNAGCLTSTCTGTTGNIGNFPPALPTWFSPQFSIVGLTNLQLSLNAEGSNTDFEVSGGYNSEDDFIISFILDGGAPVVVGDLITATGPFSNQTFLSAIPGGSMLQIAVAMNTYSGIETLSFDNISVMGDEAAPIPTPAMLPGLIGFGMSIVRKRKGEAAA